MRIYRLALTGTVLILTLMIPTGRAQATQDVAIVHLQIVDTFSGSDLGTATVESFTPGSDSRSGNLANKFVQNRASDIPFGVYRLRARATGFWSAEKDVYVFQPDTWVVLGLSFGTIDTQPPQFNVAGKVRNAHSFTSEIHLRLIGVYSELSLDTKPDGSGKFRFAGVPQATYILVTIRANQVLDARRVQVPGIGLLEVDVGEKSKGKHEVSK